MLTKQFSILWGSISITIALLAFVFVPKTFIDWDLLRLFKHLDNIRAVGLDSALQFSEYRTLYVVKYWMLFVSKTGYNGLFQSIPLLMDFLIFGYILKDMTYNNYKELRVRKLFLSICIWISLFGLKLAISDVRCNWAMAICCLALYFEFFKKEKKFFSVVLYIAAVFIHHYAVLFIIIRCVLMFKKLIKRRWIILVVALLSQVILYTGANLIYSNVSNEYLRTIARKLLAYWDLYGFSTYFFGREASMKLLYLCFIAVFVFGYIWSTRARKKSVIASCNNPELAEKLNDTLFVLSCIGIGFAFNYLLLERLAYILAYVLAMHYCVIGSNSFAKIKLVCITPLLMYIFLINDLNIFIVNALGFYYL